MGQTNDNEGDLKTRRSFHREPLMMDGAHGAGPRDPEDVTDGSACPVTGKKMKPWAGGPGVAAYRGGGKTIFTERVPGYNQRQPETWGLGET